MCVIYLEMHLPLDLMNESLVNIASIRSLDELIIG